MFLRKALNNTRKFACSHLKFGISQYHTYPDPNEVPKITQFTPTSTSTNSKSTIDPIHRLDEKFPGVPPNTGLNATIPPETKITTLSTGLKVATQDIPGLMSSFAFVIGAGSSYETPSTIGGTHFSELLAFKSTKNRQAHELATEIEELGGIVQCISTRESIMYCVDILRENIEPALDILADSVLNPLFPEEEIEETRTVVELQQEELNSDIFSKDAVQLAAFKGSPLGNPHYCSLDKVQSIGVPQIQEFRKQYLIGENCLISASGVDHDSFVKLVEAKFATIPRGSIAVVRASRSTSKYTGGIVINERPLKEPFVRLAMAFESVGWHSESLVVACVLQQLLGGGSSFSAGGPGKGMYSRLYSRVLNQNYWVESVEAFVTFYEETGLFGIDSSFPPNHAPDMIKIIFESLARLAVEPVSEEELSRAKNMLRSMMMMQLESRLVVCEDIARQVGAYGQREAPHDVSEKIKKVTAQDIQLFAKKLMQTAHIPSVGMVGEGLSNLPSYEQIQRFTSAVWNELKKKHNL